MILLGERDDHDAEVASAVRRVREHVDAARRRLNLPSVSFAGVPTVHSCAALDGRAERSCDACMARSVSL